jgi:hypothetical protein
VRQPLRPCQAARIAGVIGIPDIGKVKSTAAEQAAARI